MGRRSGSSKGRSEHLGPLGGVVAAMWQLPREALRLFFFLLVFSIVYQVIALSLIFSV